jgi:hypothetical protein
MHGAFSAGFQLSLLVAALASTCAAGALLLCEYFGSRRLAYSAPGLIAAVLALLAVGAFLLRLPGWFACGLGGLGGTLSIAWLLRCEPARAKVAALSQPKTVWAALLLVSLLASRFLAASVLTAVQTPQAPGEVDLADVPVLTMQAITDKGRPIALFHFKMHSAAEQVQQFVQQNEKEHAQLIRLLDANPASNCHGWVFTAGQYGIRDPEVSLILTDHEYEEATQPRKGDLAIYRRDGQICHCGLVRMADKHAPILIESKWGPLGVYLHATSAHPFGGECRFYRSARQNHVLALQHSPATNTALSMTMPKSDGTSP